MTAHREPDPIARPLRRFGIQVAWVAGVVAGVTIIGGAAAWLWDWSPAPIRARAMVAQATADTAVARLTREEGARVAADIALRDSLALTRRESERVLKIVSVGSILWTEPKDSEEYRDAVRKLRRMRTFTLNP